MRGEQDPAVGACKTRALPKTPADACGVKGLSGNPCEGVWGVTTHVHGVEMNQVLVLEAGRLLAHGGEFTADEFGRLAVLSLPVLVLFTTFVVAYFRRSGGGPDADPS